MEVMGCLKNYLVYFFIVIWAFEKLISCNYFIGLFLPKVTLGLDLKTLLFHHIRKKRMTYFERNREKEK